jgi:D-alanyl-D-alanine carboxypeptidase/D-alanyl-D-alanine-endopeptidase (penicillin-binding protein 4)
MKMVTMAVALERLGGNFRWKTEIWHDGIIHDGILNGNLYIKGYGNPNFQEEDMEQLARIVRDASIRSISGAILFDGSYFDEIQLGPSVEPYSLSLYDPRESALSFGFNIMHVSVSPGYKAGEPAVVRADPPSSYFPLVNTARTTSRASALAVYQGSKPRRIIISGRISRFSAPEERYFKIKEPELFFTAAFLDKLKASGIACSPESSPGLVKKENPRFKLLGTHLSPPLTDLLWIMGKKSNNFVAEQLFKTLGAELVGPPGSFAKGALAMSAYLAELGHGPDKFTILDGSGLSHENRLSADVLMSILQHIYSSDILRPAFVDSLAWAGMDGTLGDRLVDPETAGRIFAKTGSLSGVSALSGYVAAPRLGDLAFSIMINGSSGGRAKRIEDAIVKLLAEE